MLLTRRPVSPTETAHLIWELLFVPTDRRCRARVETWFQPLPGILHPPTAAPAAHQALQQPGALACGAAAFPAWPHVRVAPPARREVLVPTDIARMMIGEADSPLFARQHDPTDPHPSVQAEMLLLARPAECERPGAKRTNPSLAIRTVTNRWTSAGSVSHTAPGAVASSSLTASMSCPDIATSVFTGGSTPPRTRLQPLTALQQQPPARERRHRANCRLAWLALGRICPARRHRPRRAIDHPADHRRHAIPVLPPQRVQLAPAQLARRRDQPHPIRKRVNNMRSVLPTRAAGPIP